MLKNDKRAHIGDVFIFKNMVILTKRFTGKLNFLDEFSQYFYYSTGNVKF